MLDVRDNLTRIVELADQLGKSSVEVFADIIRAGCNELENNPPPFYDELYTSDELDKLLDSCDNAPTEDAMTYISMDTFNKAVFLLAMGREIRDLLGELLGDPEMNYSRLLVMALAFIAHPESADHVLEYSYTLRFDKRSELPVLCRRRVYYG